MEDNLQPILLFKIKYKYIKKQKKLYKTRGVYYIPQRGVGIEDLASDGSVRSIARHIANTPGYGQIEGVEIHPTELSEKAITEAIADWIHKSA